MRAWPIFLGSLVLGVIFGGGLAWYRMDVSYPWDGTPNGVNVAPTPVAKSRSLGGPASASVDQATYDFGTLQSEQTGQHDFKVRNVGGETLHLSAGTTTCGCTKFDLDKTTLEPDETATASVTWTTRNFRGPFRQSATITTDDMEHPRLVLTIVGKVTSATKVDPTELTMNDTSAGDNAAVTAKIFHYMPGPFILSDPELSNKSTASLFEVTWEPISTEELKKEEGAIAGYLLKVLVKPGLPLGAFQQTIRVKTNLAETPKIEIPLHGTITSDITVAGAGWSSEYGLLSVGNVDSAEGAERKLYIVVRGQFRKQVSLKKIEVKPSELLDVQIEEPSEMEGGDVLRIPLSIRIPKGSHPANYLGGEGGRIGEILLETGHPRAPKMLIRVRFAIEG